MGVTEKLLRRERMQASLTTLIEMFCATKQTEGKSAKTIDWYRAFLLKFATHLGPTATLRDFTLERVREFIISVQEKDTRYDGSPRRKTEAGNVSAYTVHAYVRSLKVFSSWLYEEGFTPKNTLARLKAPKLPETIVDVLTEEEQRLILSTPNPNCLLGSRLYVCLLLLLDTGIRAEELCTLTVENVHLNEGYIKVVGKGNKERQVPIGATTKKAILRYLMTFRPEPVAGNYLILTPDGHPLSYDGLRHMIERLREKTGISRLHAHLFRHTFAVNYLVNGGDLMTLKLMLGHTRLEVTEKYLHLANRHVALQHHKFSQVDRLGLGHRKKKEA